MSIDTIELTKDLIRCPSVTPVSAGVMDVLDEALSSIGFVVHRKVFSEDGYDDTENLYARLGTEGPNLCFAGHTDVVPAGDESRWTSPPFEPTEKDGILYGRGTEDMKGAIGAFVAAVSRFVEAGEFKGSISLLITNDEEGVAVNGTKKALYWIEEMGEKLDHCIVGEPTNPTELGQMIKVGRRGSITCDLTVRGKQGHVAYPDNADNPVSRLVNILHEMQHHRLDEGTEFFPPSNLEVTSIDVDNETVNIIPYSAHAKFNIRYNNTHTGESLERWMHDICKRKMADYELNCRISGDAFLNEDKHLTALMVQSVIDALGVEPECSTTGGTSDARFIKDYCPVIEFGTTGRTAHMVDEHVSLDTLNKLSSVYELFLQKYFK